MPTKKKQRRRSISVRALTFQRFVKLAWKLYKDGKIEHNGWSTALEYVIAQACEAHGIPVETVLEPVEKRTGGPEPGCAARHGGYFTF